MTSPLANGVREKVLIMAGGTGGHVFPALTIAQELMTRGAEVEWLGTRQGLEARVIGATDIPMHFISIGGLRGKSLVKKLLAPFVIVRAVIQAVLAIRQIKPGCVLGMGGFVTGPGGIAARMLGKKLIIHEQNAIAGLTNQLLFPFTHVVMEAFPGAFRKKQQLSHTNNLLNRMMAPEKIQVVGNPVRAEILALAPAESRLAHRQGALHVLVLGGSLGAVAINRVMPELLAGMNEADRPLVRHQCGDRNLDATLQLYRDSGLELDKKIQVQAFIQDMAEAYEWADIVICRAGASTIAELAVAGLPSILVPYPSAVDDHQAANARTLEQAGAAWVVPQKEFTAEKIARILASLAANHSRLLQRARAAASMAKRDATSRAATLCLEACHG
jgi:UDP-N-acetylglucosamine--N-acetylmuramyl-(pentapeptide) pyrophosphoryl-undecaprenol N-acetylglucosamine transferase